MFGLTSRTKPPTNLKAAWQADIGDHVIAQAWSPDGRQLVAVAISGSVTMFDAATGVVIHRLAGHAFGASAVSWNPQGNLLATAG